MNFIPKSEKDNQQSNAQAAKRFNQRKDLRFDSIFFSCDFL